MFFVTLIISEINYYLVKKPCSLLLTDNIKLDGISNKVNENYMPVLFCISSFEITSYKKLRGTAWF